MCSKCLFFFQDMNYVHRNKISLTMQTELSFYLSCESLRVENVCFVHYDFFFLENRGSIATGYKWISYLHYEKST